MSFVQITVCSDELDIEFEVAENRYQWDEPVNTREMFDKAVTKASRALDALSRVEGR